MRTKLVLTFVLCLSIATIFCSKIKSEMKMEKKFESPFSAHTKETILAWGEKEGTGCEDFEYTCDGNHVIVLLVDYASGQYNDTIYIFAKTKEMKRWEWECILMRPTDTEVKVYQENDKLIFKTVTDDFILEQSLKALGPFGEMVINKKLAKKQESDHNSTKNKPEMETE